VPAACGRSLFGCNTAAIYSNFTGLVYLLTFAARKKAFYLNPRRSK
jgi:hypothetical protein